MCKHILIHPLYSSWTFPSYIFSAKSGVGDSEVPGENELTDNIFCKLPLSRR